MTHEMELDDDELDTYDNDGNVKPGGLYDAGGHIIASRLADYIDYARERAKDERVFGE
jgi:hypothetical protein